LACMGGEDSEKKKGRAQGWKVLHIEDWGGGGGGILSSGRGKNPALIEGRGCSFERGVPRGRGEVFGSRRKKAGFPM